MMEEEKEPDGSEPVASEITPRKRTLPEIPWNKKGSPGYEEYKEKRKTWKAGPKAMRKPPRPPGRPVKKISDREREWANYMVDNGVGCIIAARHVFGWKCIPGTSEYRSASILRRHPRVADYMLKRQEAKLKEVDAAVIIGADKKANEMSIDSIYKYCYQRLEQIRDNTALGSGPRYKAIQNLEKLYDPSGDIHLITRWMDLLWRGALVHCPCCHETFPMASIENKRLEEYRVKNEEEPIKVIEDVFDRKMEIFKRMEARKKPHPSQKIVLSAPERDIVGLGAARGGKSFLLATMALMAFLIPGVEVWILARIFADAQYEILYLTGFLDALFYPHRQKLVSISEDKNGETTFESKWGSAVKVKSASAKGSIMGAELELAGIAEPGWVDDAVLGQLRARMTSRLGRIIMLGTPQGFGGVLGRMVHATKRDEKTGRHIIVKPEQRTIEAGCPWNKSMKLYQLDPNDNPEYVQSEREAARFMLTDAEYDTEFSGLMVSTDGSKFPAIKPSAVQIIENREYMNCKFVLGVDQGTKNFAACLVGFNGQKIFVAREYFEKDDNTILYHMKRLRVEVPGWIQSLTGGTAPWELTIFDIDPLVVAELEELKSIGMTWPTEYTWRPKGANTISWRNETYEFINQMAERGNLIFDPHVEILHDQLMRAQNKVEPTRLDKDTMPDKRKGWVINDPHRGDHVCDALVMAAWTVCSKQVFVPASRAIVEHDPWAEARASQRFQFAVQEARELSGKKLTQKEVESMFEKNFGRRRRVRPLYRDY